MDITSKHSQDELDEGDADGEGDAKDGILSDLKGQSEQLSCMKRTGTRGAEKKKNQVKQKDGKMVSVKSYKSK